MKGRYKLMYDELVRQMRACCNGEPCEEANCCFNPKSDLDCIEQLLTKAADAIEELSEQLENETEYATALNSYVPQWIPVTERLPDTCVDVLVKFPHNMAVASIDIGEWAVNIGDGWCTDINLAGGEKNPTHWMPLPQPPKEE